MVDATMRWLWSELGMKLMLVLPWISGFFYFYMGFRSAKGTYDRKVLVMMLCIFIPLLLFINYRAEEDYNAGRAGKYGAMLLVADFSIVLSVVVMFLIFLYKKVVYTPEAVKFDKIERELEQED